MARIFRYDNRDMPDPDPALSIDEVRDHLSSFFPELATATHKTETKGANEVITFERRVGTKGATPDTIREIILRGTNQEVISRSLIPIDREGWSFEIRWNPPNFPTLSRLTIAPPPKEDEVQR